MAGGRSYEMAFRLNAKLGKSYNSTFSQAEALAKKAFSNIAKIGAAVLGGIGIADMANTYKDFQQSMANTGAIAGVSKGSKEFKALENAALEAGRKTTKTAQEAADALGYMSLAGWDSKQSISGLMPVLRLSEATGADLAATSDLVTDSMSAMGVEVSELSKYLDVAAQANNKSNQTATQLMEAYIGVGGKFKGLNTNMEESAAILGVLANRGIKGSEAGNALSSVLTNLTKKGGESAVAMKALGLSAFDKNGKFKGITTVIGELSEKLKGLQTEEKRTQYIQMIGGKTQENTLRALLSGYETFTEGGKRELIELQEEMANSKGALDTMAEAMNDTLGGALSILGSASDDVKIQIMKELEPTITPIIRKIADALPGLGAKIADFIKSVVKKGKALWSDLKPVFDWIVNNFDKIKVGIAAVGGAFVTAKIVNKIKSITTAVKGLTTVAKANPLLLLAEGIVAVGTACNEALDQAKASDLAERFGNITLSAEEMEQVIDSIVGGKKFEKLTNALNIKKKLRESEKTLSEYVNTMEKIEFKLKIGVKLETDEQEEYENSANEYINGVGEFMQEQWRSDLMLFDGNKKMQDAVNSLYKGLESTYKGLGEDLSKAVTDAFKDGIVNFDEAKIIAEKRNKLAEFEKKVAKKNADDEMNKFLEGLDLSSLTPESFSEAIASANKKISEIETSMREKGFESKKTINSMEVAGILTEEEAKNEKIKIDEEIDRDIQSQISKVTEKFTKPIYDTYGNEIKENLSDIDNDLNASYKRGDDGYYAHNGYVYNVLFGKRGIKETENLEDFYLAMQPLAENYKKYMKSGGGTERYKEIEKEYERLIGIGAAGYNDDAMGVYVSGYYSDKNKEKLKGSAKTLRVPIKTPGIVDLDNLNQSEKTSIGQLMPASTVKIAKMEPLISLDDERTMASVRGTGGPLEQKIKEMIGLQGPVETELKVNAKTSFNWSEFINSAGETKSKAEQKIKETIGPTPVNTNLKVETKAYLDRQNLEDSAFSAKREAENIALSIFKNATVNGKLNVRLAVSQTMEIVSQKIEEITGDETKGFATGTEYTPETFIAGEKGAELITGARGRKVFTALETGNIFSNIGRIKDTLVTAAGAVNVFNKLKEYDPYETSEENESVSFERIVRPSGGINNNSNVSININNEIKIDGADTKNTENLKDLINKAMEESGEQLMEKIIDVINQNNERKVRLAN